MQATCEPLELLIEVDWNRERELIAAIDAALNDGWERDHEALAKAHPAIRQQTVCYKCTAKANRPAAVLGLGFNIPPGLLVTAGVQEPKDSLGYLSDQEKNAVLADFHQRVVSKLPALLPFDVAVSLG